MSNNLPRLARARGRRDSQTLSAVYDPNLNGLNLVRLLLAAGVIFWHSVPLTGNTVDIAPLRQLLGQVWVDGFFAVSGFLIVGSWARRPRWRSYLFARSLRILPGFWVCLIVTAALIAPAAAGAFGLENVTYVLRNMALWVFQHDIAGTPEGVPYPGVWNGSLWTIAWEFACYIGVLVLGVTGLLTRRFTIPILFAAASTAALVLSVTGIENWWLTTATRFGIMFLAGAMIWRYSPAFRVSWLWAGVALAVLAGSLWLPDYRVVAALPLAYLLLSAGFAIKVPALRFENDISYGIYVYAFPLQQALAIAGVWQLGAVAFALISVAATIPVAILSWFSIERPALRLKRKGSVAPSAPQTASVS